MHPTEQVLARLRRFARPMNPELPAVDVALTAVRRLLHGTGVPFKLVGGVAVVHHGYARTTEDIGVLVDAAASSRLEAGLAAHFLEVEVAVPRDLRPRLTTLRRDALEELAQG